jgi:transposase
MSYDIKFRRHVLEIREREGLSFSKVAERFGINRQTVYNWTKRIDEKKIRARMPDKLDLEALRRDVETHPDAYQYERAERFGVSTNCIWRALKRLGVTYKKKSHAPQSGFRKAVYVLPKNR